MNARTLLLVCVVLAVLVAGWFVLRPLDGPSGNGNGPEPTPGPGEPGRGTGVDAPPPPTPGAGVKALLESRGPDVVRRELAELAATEEGVAEILAAIPLTESAARRALLYLHLVRGATSEGLAAVRAAAEGKGRPVDRMPALYALAGKNFGW